MTFCLLTISPQSVRYSPSIRPHHPLLLVVQREAVGPGPDLHVSEHHVSAAATHGRRLDTRESGIPVCPEQDSR